MPRLGADRGGRQRAGAGLAALDDQHDDEAAAVLHATADHVDVARLEDPSDSGPAGNSTVPSGNSGSVRAGISRGERREQLVVQSAEAAVAHDST